MTELRKETIPIPAVLRNHTLSEFLFVSSRHTLSRCGIVPTAQENWKTFLRKGEIPTLDQNGRDAQWFTLERFEQYVQALYDSLDRNKKKGIRKSAQMKRW